MGNAAKDLYASVVSTGGKQRVSKGKHSSVKASQETSVVTVAPRSADEIASVLVDAKTYPSPVRPVGSGSTTTRATKTASGTLADMTQLNRVLSMTEQTVTVQAGIRLSELEEYLAADGFELAGGCADNNRTVGGAISSPTMSAVPDLPASQFSSSVVSLTLINTRGRKVEVGNKTRELLSLVRTSYGLLGIIYSATLLIRPKMNIAARQSKADFVEFARQLPVYAEKGAALHATCYPFRDRVHIEQHVLGGAEDHSASASWRLKDWASSTVLPKVAEQSGRFKRLVLAEEVTSCAWYFPADRFAIAFITFQKFSARHYRETRFRCDLPAEVWFAGADSGSLLSPCFDGPAFVLNIRSTRSDGWDDFAMGFAEFAAHFRGAPLFSQTQAFRPGYARLIYTERLRRFRAMRQKLDPEDRLLNQYFEEHLV